MLLLVGVKAEFIPSTVSAPMIVGSGESASEHDRIVSVQNPMSGCCPSSFCVVSSGASAWEPEIDDVGVVEELPTGYSGRKVDAGYDTRCCMYSCAQMSFVECPVSPVYAEVWASEAPEFSGSPHKDVDIGLGFGAVGRHVAHRVGEHFVGSPLPLDAHNVCRASRRHGLGGAANHSEHGE